MLYMEKEVREGISWLDAKFPGWEKLIDFEKLDMGHHDSCVVGQLELKHRVRDALLEAFLDDFPKQLGFNIPWPSGDRWDPQLEDGIYDDLAKTWKTLLSRRSAAT